MVGADDSSELWRHPHPWSSVLEGDEQLDRQNSQMSLECCHACVAKFFGFVINTTAYHLGRYSLHSPLLKSSTEYQLRSIVNQHLHNLIIFT